MIIRQTIIGLGDVRAKLARLIGAAKADETIGPALQAGAVIFGDEIQKAMPTAGKLSRKRQGERGRLKRSVRKGVKGRTTAKGPMYFSAIDRKAAPQGRFLYTGTRRQKARPEIFDGAIRAGRSRARAAVVEKLIRIQWDRV